jgi:hypothetical protein
MSLLGNWRRSLQFFVPIVVVSLLLFCAFYFTGWYHSWGVWPGYGWTTSGWLNSLMNAVGYDIPSQYYWIVFGVLYSLISVPIQELIFRVLPQKFIQNKWISIGISTIIFTLIHLYYMKPISLILIVFLALVTSFDYSRNRSFMAIWLFHVVTAYMAFTLNLA